jgi:hypothetical protein
VCWQDETSRTLIYERARWLRLRASRFLAERTQRGFSRRREPYIDVIGGSEPQVANRVLDPAMILVERTIY